MARADKGKRSPDTAVNAEERPAAEWVAIDKIHPWEANPRKNDHAVEAVANSIKRLGFGAPIVARMNGEIIAGHTRYKAALQLGLDRVPVRFVDLDPADARIMALADNKLGEIATWDDDTLGSLLGGMDAADALLAGWNGDEVDRLLRDAASPSEPDEKPLPSPPDNPTTKPGDIIALGKHTLICCDCRDVDAVKRVVAAVDLIVTSPPYASQRVYDEKSPFRPIPPDEYIDWWEGVQAAARALLADDGSFFVNIKEHVDDGVRHTYVKRLMLAMIDRWDWAWIEEFAWCHGGTPKNPRGRLKSGWEPVFQFAHQRRPKFFPDAVRHHTDDEPEKYDPSRYVNIKQAQGRRGVFESKKTTPGLAYPSTALRIGKNRVSLGHPAAFSVDLAEFFVKGYSAPGDTVWDPFMGSGSTLMACERTGRAAIGTEISPAYCDIIVQRWEAETGGTATRTS